MANELREKWFNLGKGKARNLKQGAGHDEDHHDTTPSPYGATPPPDPGAGREN